VLDDSPVQNAGLGNLYDCPFFMTARAVPNPAAVKPRVIVYIDGFNLYYGAVRATPALKWLDLERYCRLLRLHDDLRVIRYFTALIDGPTKPHQEAYLRALATTPLVEIILGKFKQKNARCDVASCTLPGSRFYTTQEEKRTDVNIAVFMLDDAYQDLCDHFIVFSGDSDLVPALNMVRLRFPAKKITVYVPSRNPVRGAAVEIRTAAHVNRTLPLNLLSKAQFPDRVPDGAGGFIVRPAVWV
jgi:6-hydroxy-3-succinoylpyridine 3-monooxygenase